MGNSVAAVAFEGFYGAVVLAVEAGGLAVDVVEGVVAVGGLVGEEGASGGFEGGGVGGEFLDAHGGALHFEEAGEAPGGDGHHFGEGDFVRVLGEEDAFEGVEGFMEFGAGFGFDEDGLGEDVVACAGAVAGGGGFPRR